MNKLEELEKLEFEILTMKGTIGLGNGNIDPKFIFLGQNPGKDMIHAGRVFSDRNKRSSAGILLPILENLNILHECYFDNVVKSTTINNLSPTSAEIFYWLPILLDELKILKHDNPSVKIIAMGNFAAKILSSTSEKYIKISHPARVLYNYSIDSYKQEIIIAINS